MTVSHTRKRLGRIIAVAALVVFAFGAATIVAVRGMLTGGSNAGGCACTTSTITAQDGVLLGLAAIFLGGIIAGMIYMIVTAVRTRRLVRRIETGARVISRFVVFSGPHCEAFTFGFIRPKIAICAHCVATLPAAELEAVLRHEAHHVARRDPLKLFLLTALSYALFFVPLIRNLVSLYRTAVEIEADEQVENRDALGNVLLRVTSQVETVATASFASALSMRIERIVQPGWRMRARLSRGPLLASLALFTVIGIAGLTQPGSVPTIAQCMQTVQCTRSFDHVPAVYYTGSL